MVALAMQLQQPSSREMQFRSSCARDGGQHQHSVCSSSNFLQLSCYRAGLSIVVVSLA